MPERTGRYLQDMPVTFLPGETILLRHWQRDHLALVVPLRVIEDDGGSVVLWVSAGSRGWHFRMPDGRTMTQLPLPEWSAARKSPAPHPIEEGVLFRHWRDRDYS